MFLIAFTALLAAAVSIGVFSAWTQNAAEKDPMALRLRQLRVRHPSTQRVGYGERPPLLVGWRQRSRHYQIVSSLPDALDLMVVCVEAGLGMTAALQRVSSELRVTSPAVSEEFALVHQQMQAGVSRSDALRNLALRTG